MRQLGRSSVSGLNVRAVSNTDDECWNVKVQSGGRLSGGVDEFGVGNAELAAIGDVRFVWGEAFDFVKGTQHLSSPSTQGPLRPSPGLP
jgi:hypothetical protein